MDAEDSAGDRLRWHVEVLRWLEAAEQAREGTSIARPGSELAIDDEQSAPYQTSHLVAHCMAVASDALGTARILLDDRDTIRIPLIGLYPVLRTAIEASALATWLLVPDDRLDRLERSLGTRWSDLLYDNQAVIVTQTPDPGDSAEIRSAKAKVLRQNARVVRAKKRALREHAERCGVDLDLQHGRPGFGPILEEVAAHISMPSGQVRGVWHFVSGLTHPSLSRSMSMSRVDILNRNDDGTLNANMSASLSSVAMAVDAALLGHKTTLELVEARGGYEDLAWKVTEDFPLPPDLQHLRNRA